MSRYLIRLVEYLFPVSSYPLHLVIFRRINHQDGNPVLCAQPENLFEISYSLRLGFHDYAVTVVRTELFEITGPTRIPRLVTIEVILLRLNSDKRLQAHHPAKAHVFDSVSVKWQIFPFPRVRINPANASID